MLFLLLVASLVVGCNSFATVRFTTLRKFQLCKPNNGFPHLPQLRASESVQQQQQQQGGIAKTTRKRDPTNPDPSILLASQGPVKQRLGVAGVVALLAVGTKSVLHALALSKNYLPTGFYKAWSGFPWPVFMGLFYAFVGICHFKFAEAMEEIVPPYGIWGGLWKAPAPGAKALGLTYERYHNYWSGAAEIILGGGLALAGVGAIPIAVNTMARLLFLLTVAVTPANIYMFTHNLSMKGLPKVQYPETHIARGIFQCIFLSIFWTLSVK